MDSKIVDDGVGLSDDVIKVSALLRQANRVIMKSEKRKLHDHIIALLTDQQGKRYMSPTYENQYTNPVTKYIYTDTLQTLSEDEIPLEQLHATLKRYQYHLLEEQLANEIANMPDAVTDTNDEEEEVENQRPLELPDIHCKFKPIKPTALLQRVIEKHNMKNGIVVPTMNVKDTDRCSGDTRSTYSLSDRKTEKGKLVPYFTYEHRNGGNDNLPVIPGLVRFLTDPDIDLHGFRNGNVDGTDKNKQRTGKKKVLCQFCRMPPGGHQKWCIYFDTDKIEDDKPKVKKSYIDDSLYARKHIKPPEKPPPRIRRANTFDISKHPVDPDRPEYANLHRDVYIRALAISRARRVIKKRKTYDFLNQLTKPFEFSYNDNLDQPSQEENVNNGMKHIFGKETKKFNYYYKQIIRLQTTPVKRDTSIVI